MSIAGLVLAAGSGTRFGGTKQLALLGGRPLVAHVVTTAAAAGLDPLVVVVGHDGERVAEAVLDAAPRAVVVRNPDHADGQASSLRTGVDHLATTDAAALVVLLADEPGVPVAAVDAVVAAHHVGATIARAVYDDRPGHPVLLVRAVWPQLTELTGDVGARDLLRGPDVTAVRIDGPAAPDVDHPADLPGSG